MMTVITIQDWVAIIFIGGLLAFFGFCWVVFWLDGLWRKVKRWFKKLGNKA